MLALICAASGEGNSLPTLRPPQAATSTRITSPSSHARLTCPPLSRQRDDARFREALDLGRREPELAEDFGGVLAEQRRCASDRRRRRRGSDREAEHSRRPVAGLLDGGHEPEVLHLRVLEDLVEL